MKKIRDFFYNCNDIIAVLIILLAAATLIYWRVNIILDYPATLAAENAVDHSDTDNEVIIEEAETTSDDETADAEKAEAEAEVKDEEAKEEEAATKDDETKDGKEAESAETKDEESKDAEAKESEESKDKKDEDKEDEKGPWKDGKLKEDMLVYIEPGDAVSAVEILVDAGIFESYDEYVELCEKEDINPGSIQTMEFTLAEGSTKEDIIRLVTNN